MIIIGVVVVLAFMALGGLFILAAVSTTPASTNVANNTTLCASGVNDGPGGACCGYVCTATCPGGYKPNTCRCECLDGSSGNATVAGISDVFGEPEGNFTMPALPPG